MGSYRLTGMAIAIATRQNGTPCGRGQARRGECSRGRQAERGWDKTMDDNEGDEGGGGRRSASGSGSGDERRRDDDKGGASCVARPRHKRAGTESAGDALLAATATSSERGVVDCARVSLFGCRPVRRWRPAEIDVVQRVRAEQASSTRARPAALGLGWAGLRHKGGGVRGCGLQVSRLNRVRPEKR